MRFLLVPGLALLLFATALITVRECPAAFSPAFRIGGVLKLGGC